MNDPELLHAWATRRDEPAFAELVRRHLDLVYGSALRQVREPVLAREVAQAVFLVLADKAGSLGGGVILSGWLFRTTRFVAARALRAERRRTHHEQQAAAMQRLDLDTPPAPDRWGEVEPHLDAALAALPATDRHAVLLRFFEQQPLRAVGDRLGVGEEAAKKRVSRAVEKLRAFLVGKGVVLTAAGLLALLTELPTSAAPAELAGQISAAVGTGSAGPAATELANGAARDWFTARLLDVAPWFAAALVLLMAGATWLAIPTSPEGNQVAEASTTEAVVPLPAPSPVTSPVLAPAAQVGPSKILLNVRSAEDNRPLAARGMVVFWARWSVMDRQEVATDTNGTVEIPATDPKLDAVILSLSAPGRVPVTVRWNRHEFVEPVLLHTSRLQRGQTLQGVVQDEAGRPVAEARVQFNGPEINRGERENVRFSPPFDTVVTDASGRFQSDQMPSLIGRFMSYTVSHPDFVRELRGLNSSTTPATNHLVVLRRGLFVKGHIIGPDDEPIAEAKVSEDPNFGASWEKRSAADGRFALGPFPAGPVRLEVSASGFKTVQQAAVLGAETEDVVIKLPPDADRTDAEPVMVSETFRIVGTVVDAESGQAIPRFRVCRTQQRGTVLDLVGEGHAGRFDWPIEINFMRRFSLEVEAEGYEPEHSDTRFSKDGTQEFAFRLRRGGNVSGLVIGPDGRPAAGAVVGLNGPTFGFYIRAGDRAFSGNGAPQTETDVEGRFKLRLRLGTQTVLVEHELGCVLVPVAEASRAPIVLQPWGAIEGTVLVGGKPAAGQTVWLRECPSDDDATPPGIRVEGAATSDANGRFRFGRMPAGSVNVSRCFDFNRGGSGPVGLGKPQRVEVPAGGTAEVTIGTVGRAVVGRLALASPVAGYDWRDDLQSLVQVWDGLPPVKPSSAFPGSPEFMKEIRASTRLEMLVGKHFLAIQPDGSFRIDDVPPGNYTLGLRVSTPPQDVTAYNEPWRRPELGKVLRPVLVPDSPDPASAAPLDLGTITIPVKQP